MQRWSVLAAYTAVAGVSQMLWLNFAPLISFIQERYGVGEFEASGLILVFPALYVPLSLHSGAMIDRYGYRKVVGAAGVLMAVFAGVRIYDASFLALFVGQCGVAVAQPYVVNAISKLVADWFEEDQHGLATGIGTIGMFLGMALALALTPALNSALGLQLTMVVFAGLSLVAALAFLVFARDNPQSSGDPVEEDVSLFTLLRNRDLVLLFLLALLALGFFNGLTTWLEPILGERGIDAESAGLVGGMLILGGIVGSAILPALSDRSGRRKPYLIFCGVSSVLLVYPLCTATDFGLLLALGAATGFCFLPGYALLFAMTEEHAGKAHAGGAAGWLMLAGNAGGVVVVVAMEAIKSQSANWSASVYFMMALMAATTVLALLVGESFHRKQAE